MMKLGQGGEGNDETGRSENRDLSHCPLNPIALPLGLQVEAASGYRAKMLQSQNSDLPPAPPPTTVRFPCLPRNLHSPWQASATFS